MTESALAQLLQSAGPAAAAIALLYILYLLVNGKLHTNSELEARDEVIEKLERMNATVVDQLKQTNDIFERAIERGYTAKVP